MQRFIEAAINGQPLRGVDPRILLRETADGGAQIEQTWADSPGRPGQRRALRKDRARRLTVTFAIRELYDLTLRAQVVDAVNAWARDGWLEYATRPDQRIHVYCAGLAAVGASRDYTEEFTVSFDAAPSPYWQSRQPGAYSYAGARGGGTVTNLGSAPTELRLTVTPTGGRLDTLTLTLGAQTMTFADLAVASGTALALGYDDDGYQYIRAGSASKLSCRAAASADDLILDPGGAAFGFTANVACNVSVEVIHKWL